ncbi:hypothetical protein [Rickettsia prowazekii]|nr:hypothetical protein [Rickettsia prowazekii]ADE30100.1 hypothetical protein rpr22_CDS542 [Rickettsia prowazekii str. Rp22]AFE49366.1 hypothetical protein M9W_02705 [Rickettsia prowazekii str. Chernikova]AFE51056.1 hypothetical protein MA1_02700 [Rickettsia prowazekii str. BuV67-CWPP]AFE51892.1 hypothetical protein MA3_02735 [Rickettsia prowazekii str. Dachau]AGJ02277.1 hypothetical protein H375_510 [Rickettsia prowazekii str. Breinl]
MSTNEQDDQIIKELEERLATLKGTPPSIEELEERLAKIQDTPYIYKKKSSNEVDNLIEQMQSELKLEQKSKSLNDQKDQVIRDRLDKLRGNSPVKETFIDFSFNDTKSIITDTISAQADVVSAYANRATELEDKKALLHLSNNLIEARDIIMDTPSISKEYDTKIFDVIASGLAIIYEGIKKIATPAVNIIKEIGNIFINSIKSLSQKSSEKQIEESKKELKKLYKSYTDLKGVDEKVKKEFLKKHYQQIDKLQTPKEIFLETAKITKSISIVGKQKINNLKQQQIMNRMQNESPSSLLNKNSFTPFHTPTNKVKSSKSNQR